MEKIVLIEPKTRKGHVYRTTQMPRLGLPLLGTQLKEAGYHVNIYVAGSDALPWKKILQADLVGISTTTSTSREAYKIAGYLRSQNIPVVMGGIHATFMPEEALQYADYIVRGEADHTFLELVRTLEEGAYPEDIPGVSYWRDGRAIHNPPRQGWVDLEELPITDLTLLNCYKKIRAIPVMTSRGCPFNCIFCSVTPMFGRRYRCRSNEQVLQELSFYKGRHVFFCDDNFTADLKRTKEILKKMLEQKINLKGWGAQVRVEAAKDEELLELMRLTRGNIVYIGFESINPSTLESFNKKQSIEDIQECIRKFHEYGIRIHGMFIFGSDEDTIQTFRDTVDFAIKMRIDTVQFMILTPLPGTPLFKKLESEGRLLTKDWELYDGHHVVFQPAKMSAWQLQKETVKAYMRFYSLKHLFQNLPLTGWGSALYRGVGWYLVKSFRKENYRYSYILEQLQNSSYKAQNVPLLYRRIQVLNWKHLEEKTAGNTSSLLKIYLSENNGIFYLRLKGLLNKFTLKELNRTLKSLLPQRCYQLVVNAEGLYFSEKSIKSFSLFLERLCKRVNRMQLIYSPEAGAFSHFKKLLFKIPRFELLTNRH